MSKKAPDKKQTYTYKEYLQTFAPKDAERHDYFEEKAGKGSIRILPKNLSMDEGKSEKK